MENLVFDPKANLVSNLNAKLEEVGIELTEPQKDALVNCLLERGILAVDRIKDLEDFIHYESSEDEVRPVKTLLVNHLLVYLFEEEKVVRAHESDYREYLEDNDLYSDEYGYDEFLRDNDLVETFPTENITYCRSTEIGELFFNALRTKESAEKQLELANNVINKLQPVISDNFLPIVSE